MAGNSDLLKNSRLFNILAPISVAATKTGATVDRKGYDEVMIELSLGTTSSTVDSSNHVVVTVEDSADNSTFAVVTSAAAIQGGTMDTIASGIWKTINSEATRDAAKSKVHRLTYRGTKRYVRIVITITGTIAWVMGASALGFQAAYSGNTSLQPDFSAGNDGVAVA